MLILTCRYEMLYKICVVYEMLYKICVVYEMLYKICVVQIQPRKRVLDHAGYTAPTRQHKLDHTDHTDHTDLKDMSALPGRSRS